VTASAPPRRRYDSAIRRQRAAETRERIVGAAFELLQESSIRDWGAVTIRAVAERAVVNERTVYRHFPNERALRDAVMQRFESEAGIDIDHLTLAEVADVAARAIGVIASHPASPRTPLDATLRATDQRRRNALRAAVGTEAPRWSEPDRDAAAAVLDVLWGVAAYDRLAVDWQLDPQRTTAALTWAIRLVEAAIREGRPPA
jgi:AcrR family transcriptional regulator